MSAKTLLTSLFKYKAWANSELFSALQSLESVPNADRNTMILLLNHVFVVDSIFAAHLRRLKHGYAMAGTAETPSLEDLSGAVSRLDRWYIEYVTNVPNHELEEAIEFAFTDGASGRMSREEMLAHVINHGGYHRGEVGRIISQLSLPRPRDIFTGYLHKSDPSRRERV